MLFFNSNLCPSTGGVGSRKLVQDTLEVADGKEILEGVHFYNTADMHMRKMKTKLKNLRIK